MTVALGWLVVAGVGLAIAAASSSRGVEHAAALAQGLGMPAFLVGFTLVAVGTDVPEIANSIASSFAGQGDINVGDSVGSSLAQATLVAGLVPLLAGRLAVPRRNVAMLGLSATVALLIGTALVADGHLGRLDGLLLVGTWAAATAVLWRITDRPPQPELPLPSQQRWRHTLATLGFLGLVAIGASVAVLALTRAATVLEVPVYLVSFLGLALGTSLPELTVAVSATRSGRGDLALGNILGATLADASLSMGSGPILAPTDVTAELVVTGGLVTAVAVTAATAVLVAAGRHTWVTGLLLIGLYVGTVPLLTGA